MANVYISQAGAGSGTGTSWANRAPQSSFSSLEATMGAGDTMYIAGETITLTATWTVTGAKKNFIGVNPSTGVEDGSIAILDAVNTYANCISGNTYCLYKNIQAIRATSWGAIIGHSSIGWNLKASNNGHGLYTNSNGHFVFCEVSNNTGTGFGSASMGSFRYCKAIGNSRGFTGGISTAINCIAHANTLSGFIYFNVIEGCVVDGNGVGIDNQDNFIAFISRNSITNNTTGISTNTYATSLVYEDKNYFYNNTSKFGGTTSAIYSIGGSIDGASDPYNSRATDDFSPAIAAEMVNTQFTIGIINEVDNISFYNAGLNPPVPTSTVPTFAGIITFEPLSNGKFLVEWAAATGSVTSYDIYVRNAANPFTQKKISVDPTLTSAIIGTLGTMDTFFVGGQTYYCGVRANNSGTQDTNTVELSAICSGSEFIQRMNNTYPILKL